MGISHVNGGVDLIKRAMVELDTPMPLLRVCECGDQRIRVWRSAHKLFQSSRSVYEFFGAYYVAIDMNGKFGALALDLGKPLMPEIGKGMLGTFNLVTNFGTLEHVKDGQQQAFANVHDLCARDGIMIHCIPHTDFIHGDWQYTPEWIESLAASQGYDVISMIVTDKNTIWAETPEEVRPPRNKVTATLVNCILRKRVAVPFDMQSWVYPRKSPVAGKVWVAQ